MIVEPLPDTDARAQAVRERLRNVVVDAGAGSGKTELLVRRFVELLAPTSGHGDPIAIDRLAAITFTRRAAGELAFRIRQRILHTLADASTFPPRRRLLRDALDGLDGASIGTIHSFCDRLLRRHPVEARLPASYEVVEDTAELVRETVDLLFRGVRDGSLERIASAADPPAAEVAETLRDLPRCGLLLESVELPIREKFGFDALVDAFVRSRDVPPSIPPYPVFAPDTFRAHVREFLERVEPIAHLDGPGITLLRRIAESLRRVERQEDPVVLFGEIARPLARRNPLGEAARRRDLADDDAAWEQWGAIFGSSRKNPPRTPALRDDLLAPLQSWLANRLVRTHPVVVAVYDHVKNRRHCLDAVDLLLRLRDLLRHDLRVRSGLQGAFDHVLVDEFQDTDPLQAEILLFLAEDGAAARDWREVRVGAGRLTVVGDPKQSIYRFRRADIGMYSEVTSLLEEQGALRLELSANLRSDGALVHFFNQRFQEILGTAPAGGERFDPVAGRAYYQDLTIARSEPGEEPRVHVIPIDPEGRSADDFRRTEAEAIARYVRWLVEDSGETIAVSAGRRRAIRAGDIAILASVTTNVGLLSGPLGVFGIPHALSGGKLFLQDDLHRRFLLGLRALGDADDGVAEATLFAPPFFAIDIADVLRERAARRSQDEGDAASRQPAPGRDEERESVERAAEAVVLVRELRRRRHDRPPGDTARDLLERSAVGRHAASSPNGLQRLAGLRELCSLLERIAARDRLDFDAATAVLRDWVTSPIPLDAPPSIEDDAVRILTVHQAKGLEFPVVVLWDSRGTMLPRNDRPPWTVSADGRSWILGLDGLHAEHPRGAGLAAREQRYQRTERERLLYVAATRARDLLVVPCDGAPGGRPPGSVAANRRLLGDPRASGVGVLAAYRAGSLPGWANRPPPPAPALAFEPSLEWLSNWVEAEREVREASLVPRAVSVLAWEAAGRRSPDEAWLDATALDEAPSGEASRRSRFGSGFGTLVHRAIGLALRLDLSPGDAVTRASRSSVSGEHHEDAIADVRRALDALAAASLTPRTALLRLEYPVAAVSPDGRELQVGVADLVARRTDDWVVLDFKTDSAQQPETAFLPYEEQVRSYVRLLAPTNGPDARFRGGLLFTETGTIRWVAG